MYGILWLTKKFIVKKSDNLNFRVNAYTGYKFMSIFVKVKNLLIIGNLNFTILKKTHHVLSF